MRDNFTGIKTDKNNAQSTKHDKFIYASYTRRIMSNVIDGIILVLLLIVISEIDASSYNILAKVKPYGDYLLICSVTIIYYSFFISSNCQATLGKKICRIKVINDDGNSLKLRFSILKSTLALVFYFISILVFSLPLIYIFTYAEKIGISPVIVNPQMLGGMLLFIADLSLMYFFFGYFSKKRAFYDKVSKSHVVIN